MHWRQLLMKHCTYALNAWIWYMYIQRTAALELHIKYDPGNLPAPYKNNGMTSLMHAEACNKSSLVIRRSEGAIMISRQSNMANISRIAGTKIPHGRITFYTVITHNLSLYNINKYYIHMIPYQYDNTMDYIPVFTLKKNTFPFYFKSKLIKKHYLRYILILVIHIFIKMKKCSNRTCIVTFVVPQTLS